MSGIIFYEDVRYSFCLLVCSSETGFGLS
jgi:hypothetical protein